MSARSGPASFAELWRYFGAKGLAAKAWDRFVVDPWRFRAGIRRPMPVFPPCDPPAVPRETEAPPLRICYLTHRFYPESRGGTERFVLNLAKAQQRRGGAVCVVTLSLLPARAFVRAVGGILIREDTYEGVPVTSIRYRRTPPGLFYRRIDEADGEMRRFAAAFLADGRFDAVHCAYPQPYAAFLAMCREKGVPAIVTLTDFDIFCRCATMVDRRGQFCTGCDGGRACVRRCGMRPAEAEERYRQSARLLGSAACTAAPSSFVAGMIGREYGLLPYVIPHGLSPDFSPGPRRDATRRFVYAGALSAQKGVHLLIAAFRRLEANASLEIYGAGDAPGLRRLQWEAAGDRRIVFRGPAQAGRMPEVYRGADCAVVPSIWYETYNFVLREALACGCLAVAARAGAMPEAVAEGKNGFLFDAGDVSSLQAALEAALRFDWARYRQAAFPTVEGEAERYAELYAIGAAKAAPPGGPL